MVAYSMTHHTRQSALGLPVIEHRSYKGFDYDASEYTMSEIIASVYAYMRKTGLERGILFLDEVNCVSETLYPSMLQFLQFKTFGAHAVPDGWVIACAGNPPEFNRSVHEFDVATLDRLRKIEIEPDLEAWRSYAAEAGVHPSITTFLETQPDLFYRIESRPGAKSFVTARGWDDLGRMIALNERLDIPVDQELVEQFVQDDEIAERFFMYYELFRKYQSDYQVPSILEGTYDSEIAERARAAKLDERMALLGLIIDVIAPRADDVMLQESVLTEVRDALRSVKAAVEGGAPVVETLEPRIEEAAMREQKLADAGARDTADMRKAKRVASMLKACRQSGRDGSFEAVHQEFRGHVGAFEASVTALRSQVDNAFSFLESAFGEGRETLLFTTELAARKSTALFAARYGCNGFFRHNQNLQVHEQHDDLVERIDAAREQTTADTTSSDPSDQLAATTPGSVAGLAAGSAVESASGLAAESAAELPAGSTPETEPETSALAAYYENACWEYGYASLCHMALPANLEGRTVLDIGCRRGKGAFKLSERVGAGGRVIGIDWVADHIAQATDRMERAARETGLSKNNMEFHLAYPEDLMDIGIGNATIDVVFVNSVLHLTCDPIASLAEITRALKPGGLLICEVALAGNPRDRETVEAARALGNSIQAAPFRTEFEERLDELGFDVEIVEGPRHVEANMGFKKGHEVPTAPTSENVGFEAVVLHARKR